MQNKIALARDLALKVHKDHIDTTVAGLVRPRILHFQQVADFVLMSGGSDDEICAAWLHDTVEDTEVTIEELENKFGKNLAEIVDGLTDPTDYKGLPILERKALQAERLKTKSNSVKLIKIADQASNLHFVAIDPVNSMDEITCKNYAIGAKIIVDGCRGVCPELEKVFDKVYKMCMDRYGAVAG